MVVGGVAWRSVQTVTHVGTQQEVVQHFVGGTYAGFKDERCGGPTRKVPITRSRPDKIARTPRETQTGVHATNASNHIRGEGITEKEVLHVYRTAGEVGVIAGNILIRWSQHSVWPATE